LIRQLAEPPILIGHSFGGLFVQWAAGHAGARPQRT
jgi:pimeloyl-ACP methyl ester carboxylesterase